MKESKRYVCFVIAAVLGGVLVKVARKRVPKIMEGIMGEGGPMDM